MFELKSLPKAKYDPRVAFIQRVLKFPKDQIDGKFGPRTENKVKEFQKDNQLTTHGKIDEPTGKALNLPLWNEVIERQLSPPYRDPELHNEEKLFKFQSQRPKDEYAYFSGAPDASWDANDPTTYRSIRTNNPGALGYSVWHKDMPDFIGTTQPHENISTAIYRTPESGIAAWYTLITDIYDRIHKYLTKGESPSINVKKLVKIYGGLRTKTDEELTEKDKKVLARYLNGWVYFSEKISDFHLKPDTEVHLYNEDEMYVLASSMFSHEASFLTPISSAQINTGIGLVTGQRSPLVRNLDVEQLRKEEEINSQDRYNRILQEESGL